MSIVAKCLCGDDVALLGLAHASYCPYYESCPLDVSRRWDFPSAPTAQSAPSEPLAGRWQVGDRVRTTPAAGPFAGRVGEVTRFTRFSTVIVRLDRPAGSMTEELYHSADGSDLEPAPSADAPSEPDALRAWAAENVVGYVDLTDKDAPSADVQAGERLQCYECVFGFDCPEHGPAPAEPTAQPRAEEREPLGNNDPRIDLWDAINEYATACGGDPEMDVYGNTRRQRAVAAVERALAELLTEPTGAKGGE